MGQQSLAALKATNKDFNNVLDSFVNIKDGGSVTEGSFAYKEKISLLTDAAGAGAIRSALTLADSGTHFLVPALTSGAQTIALPAPTAANVGFFCKFTMVGTAAQIFKVQTDVTATKIVNTMDPDGDGTFTITAAANAFHFTADAVAGASFTITCISTTAAIAYIVSNIESGLAAGTGEHVAA
tara:strand:+ start:54 stop:602 length:549 start_codon:yes stop_codon:yes gene_type:complete